MKRANIENLFYKKGKKDRDYEFAQDRQEQNILILILCIKPIQK